MSTIRSTEKWLRQERGPFHGDRTRLLPRHRPLLLAGTERHTAGRRPDGRHRRCRCGRAQAGGLERRTIHDYAQRLRPFFLFAEARGWCRAGLAAGIMAPRFMADETLPKGLRREDVLRLLASIQEDRPVDKRDRAILMLLIAYGLRAGEVGGLRLDD